MAASTQTRDLNLYVGARPNFVKAAPIIRLLESGDLNFRVINTGQHYDPVLSSIMWADLAMGEPDITLQTEHYDLSMSSIQKSIEDDLATHPARLSMVFGDVTSTLAAAIGSSLHGIPVIHVEAGLRSGESDLPEEINRKLVDRLSDVLCCPSHEAVTNLHLEGRSSHEIALVGNVMIDSLIETLKLSKGDFSLRLLGLEEGNFILATLHRRNLRENTASLVELCEALNVINAEVPVVVPVHPAMQDSFRNLPLVPDFRLLDSLPYRQFLYLLETCRLVITDSGGVQEESSFLGKPCVTARSATERPVTVALGTNLLGGISKESLLNSIRLQLDSPKSGQTIPLWDGRASNRILRCVDEYLR